jgi:carbonic anhydrase
MDDKIIQELISLNKKYVDENSSQLKKYISGQNPKIAVLTCADSRVVPEFIFNKNIGELFVVRVAGKVAMDSSVISSLEYAVNHLNISHLIILGHTQCGAVKASEESKDDSVALFEEIKKGFSLNNNHIIGNVKRQYDLLFQRSDIISKAVKDDKLKFVCAIYNLESGLVEFLDFN